VRGGIFGYNALLLGLGIHVFVGGATRFTIAGALAMGCLCALVSAAIANLLVPVWRVPPFTLPFNACLFMSIAAVAYGDRSSFPGGSALVAPPVYV
jgi:urea transporter